MKTCSECLDPGVWECTDNDGNIFWMCEKHIMERHQSFCEHVDIREEKGERWCSACHKDFADCAHLDRKKNICLDCGKDLSEDIAAAAEAQEER